MISSLLTISKTTLSLSGLETEYDAVKRPDVAVANWTIAYAAYGDFRFFSLIVEITETQNCNEFRKSSKRHNTEKRRVGDNLRESPMLVSAMLVSVMHENYDSPFLL